MTKTPTREEMLKFIYEKIADKTLSFWCELMDVQWGNRRTLIYREFNQNKIKEEYKIYFHKRVRTTSDKGWEILWHPVMIGDVLDWIKENIALTPEYRCYCWNDMRFDTLLGNWIEWRNPIDEQGDECIAFIYNLCTEWKP